MAVAAPARRSSAAPAPAPSRTTPPKRRAPAKRAPAKRAPAKRAPAKRQPRAGVAAPARRAPVRVPQRARPKAKPRTRRATGQVIPLAVGRTAATVRHLPDSGLIVRMTRGRAWIGVLGVLLVGIVALNVVTLSFAASSGKIDEETTAIEQDISATAGREGTLFGADRIHNQAAEQGLVNSTGSAPLVVQAGPRDVAVAAQRLAAMGSGG
jgi:hypothetical protein